MRKGTKVLVGISPRSPPFNPGRKPVSARPPGIVPGHSNVDNGRRASLDPQPAPRRSARPPASPDPGRDGLIVSGRRPDRPAGSTGRGSRPATKGRSGSGDAGGADGRRTGREGSDTNFGRTPHTPMLRPLAPGLRQGDIANSRRDLHRLGDLCPSSRKAAGIPVIGTGRPPGLGPPGPPAGLAAGPARPARIGGVPIRSRRRAPGDRFGPR